MFKIVDLTQPVKPRWLKDPSEVNKDNQSEERREDGRHFRKKEKYI
jgi:hypothetical protein